MTECIPIASPPRFGINKRGSVGKAAGPLIAIMNLSNSSLLGPFEEGEVVVKGFCVMSGYENNPEANSKTFVNGWLRTGDKGYLDDEGYLFLSGRFKEIINRGGEKISPFEIEEALLSFPGLINCIAFSVPNKQFGEVVGVAIIHQTFSKFIKRDQENDYLYIEENSPSQNRLPFPSWKKIRNHLNSKLHPNKLPEVLVYVDEIPKGSTGKPARIGFSNFINLKEGNLHSMLRFTDGRLYHVEIIEMQHHNLDITFDQFSQTVINTLAKILQIETIDANKNFESLGMNSTQSIQFINILNELYHLDLSPVILWLYSNPRIFIKEIYSKFFLKPRITSTSSPFSSQIKPQTSFDFRQKIAVIGLALRFTGNSHDLFSFWDTLISKEEIPVSKRSENRTSNLHLSIPALFLQENPELFDYKFFDLTQLEASLMDPQQRLLLQLTWEAFENAGYDPTNIERKTGIFFGIRFFLKCTQFLQTYIYFLKWQYQ